MKKSVLLTGLLSLLTVAVMLNGNASAATDIRVVIDDRPIAFDVMPTVESGRMLVPLRTIAENMGCRVNYKDNNITITAQGNNINLQLGSDVATVNGQTVALDVPAKATSGRTLVPLRFIGENLNANVNWYDSINTVFIKTSEKTEPLSTPPPAKLWSDEILKSINDFRSEAGFTQLKTTKELNDLAYTAAQSLAEGKPLQNSAPAPYNAENFVIDCHNRAEVINMFLNDESSIQNILGGGTFFCGIGCAKSSSGKYFAVINFVDSQAFFLGERYRIVNAGDYELVGYTMHQTQDIELYRLDEQNSNTYIEKTLITANVEDGYFKVTLPLEKGWQYLAFVADDAITLIVL